MKIGFIDNLYATPKGHSYVVRDMVKMLKNAGHKVHMYRVKENPIDEEFIIPDTLKSINAKNVPKEEFIEWTKEYNFDCMVFNEYNQWWVDEQMDKVKWCKKNGIKTIGYLVWEKFDKNQLDHYKSYDKIICPTAFQTKLFRKNGLYNAVHVRWATDIDEIDAVPKSDKEKSKVTFYHCAGSGGVGDRKNTEAVIEAYKLIQDDSTDLIITHLGSKVFSRKEIISFMKYADVLINTSRWDTIGLNTIEANACGIPVIVCDAKPMNELVYDNVNGLLTESTETTIPQVFCPSNNVDVKSLSIKMSICKNKILLDTMKNNSRKFAETNFDWNKNKEDFLQVFEV